MIGNLDQEFSNFFPHVPPFFVAASVYHFQFPETLFHNTRNRNFMCRWNMHSLHSYYNYYSNYTTTVSARCDCYYFRYWIPTSKFFLLAIILLFFPGLRQNSTFYLPSIVPSGKCNYTTSGTRTTVLERLVWTACTNIYTESVCHSPTLQQQVSFDRWRYMYMHCSCLIATVIVGYAHWIPAGSIRRGGSH